MPTKKPVLDRLVDYFQSVADRLATSRESSRIFPNNTDSGQSREEILADFLRKHLPSRCSVDLGGFVFDNKGNESAQMDVLVSSENGVQFKEHEKVFAYAEACYAAISVKTSIAGDELVDAIRGVNTLPRLTRANLKVSPFLTIPDGFAIPARIVFAFEGPSVETVQRNMLAYKDANPGSQIPDLLVVNNQFCIERVTGEMQRVDGSTYPFDGPSRYFGFERQGAMNLVRLLIMIQNKAALGPHVIHSFEEYFIQMATYWPRKPVP